jgi:hypothetical protein
MHNKFVSTLDESEIKAPSKRNEGPMASPSKRLADQQESLLFSSCRDILS